MGDTEIPDSGGVRMLVLPQRDGNSLHTHARTLGIKGVQSDTDSDADRRHLETDLMCVSPHTSSLMSSYGSQVTRPLQCSSRCGSFFQMTRSKLGAIKARQSLLSSDA